MSAVEPPELSALLATLDEIHPSALTSCPGWSAHHLAAHIAGNYEEVRRHVESFAEGHPLERTRGWEERESSLRELDHGALLQKIHDEGRATSTVVEDVLNVQPDAALTWTNRKVPVAGFLTHMRSEDALHRWDLVGDDEVSAQLLAQPDLLEHVLNFIGRPLFQRGVDAGAAQEPFSARLRCAGEPDVIVDVVKGDVSMTLGAARGPATIEGDPAARLLLVWGRKPSPFFRLRRSVDGDAADHVQFLLSGY